MKKFIPSKELADIIMIVKDRLPEELASLLKEQYKLSGKKLSSPEEARQEIIDKMNGYVCFSILSFARRLTYTNNISTFIVTIKGVLIDDVWVALARYLGIPHPLEADDIRIKLSDELLQYFSVTPYENSILEEIFVRDGEILVTSFAVIPEIPSHGFILTE